jgi:hypothetical protein
MTPRRNGASPVTEPDLRPKDPAANARASDVLTIADLEDIRRRRMAVSGLIARGVVCWRCLVAVRWTDRKTLARCAKLARSRQVAS